MPRSGDASEAVALHLLADAAPRVRSQHLLEEGGRDVDQTHHRGALKHFSGPPVVGGGGRALEDVGPVLRSWSGGECLEAVDGAGRCELVEGQLRDREQGEELGDLALDLDVVDAVVLELGGLPRISVVDEVNDEATVELLLLVNGIGKVTVPLDRLKAA